MMILLIILYKNATHSRNSEDLLHLVNLIPPTCMKMAVICLLSSRNSEPKSAIDQNGQLGHTARNF